jgi:hypothetical protein
MAIQEASRMPRLLIVLRPALSQHSLIVFEIHHAVLLLSLTIITSLTIIYSLLNTN